MYFYILLKLLSNIRRHTDWRRIAIISTSIHCSEMLLSTAHLHHFADKTKAIPAKWYRNGMETKILKLELTLSGNSHPRMALQRIKSPSSSEPWCWVWEVFPRQYNRLLYDGAHGSASAPWPALFVLSGLRGYVDWGLAGEAKPNPELHGHRFQSLSFEGQHKGACETDQPQQCNRLLWCCR